MQVRINDITIIILLQSEKRFGMVTIRPMQFSVCSLVLYTHIRLITVNNS